MAAERKPIYLIAGGRGSIVRRGPDPLIREALELAEVKRPAVAYLGAASGDNAGFRVMISRMLRKAGAGEVRLAPLCGSRANPAEAMRIIEESDVVFMSGGDVEKGMRVLDKNGITGFLKELCRKGKPFFGVSAGSIMLAEKWVRWDNSEADSGAELFPCLGLARICCDTHDEENDWEELQALARLTPAGSVVYGIPSGTALAAYSDGTILAVGGAIHRFKRLGPLVRQLESLSPPNPRRERE
jgi:cyanophycinase-like exopeptidase